MPRPAPVKRRASMAPFYVILGLVVLAGIGVLASQLGGSKKTATTQPVEVNIPAEQLQQTPGISVGRTDAPITILQFADFQCPHCATFATFVEPVIKERLVDTGKARYVYYDFPLGGAFTHGFLAARGGRCANEQGKFWEWHNRVFANQRQWSYAQVDEATEMYVRYAAESGLDEGDFEECLRSDKYAAEVTQSRKFGDLLGVTGTPAIFVNSRKLPDVPRSYGEFEAQLREIAPAAFTDAPAPAEAAPPAAPAAADSAPAAQ